MERINQYLKDRTESFDDLYPTRRPRHPFERILGWLSGFKFFHNYVLMNTSLGRAPVEWNPPPWLEGSELGRVLGVDSLPRLGGDGACDLKLTEPIITSLLPPALMP